MGSRLWFFFSVAEGLWLETLRTQSLQTNPYIAWSTAHVEAIAIIENVLEHVAYFLNKDPLEVREVNLAPDAPEDKGGPNVFRSSILPLLKEKAMVDQRKLEIQQFNKVIFYLWMNSYKRA